MVRRSTVAVSTLVPALKVLSTVLLDSTFLSLVRTKAGPLPGLTCWNSTTAQSWPSMLRTMPFFRSFVVAMRACQPSYVGRVRGVAHATRAPARRVYRLAPRRTETAALPSSHTILHRHRALVPAGPDRHRRSRPTVRRQRSPPATTGVGSGSARTSRRVTTVAELLAGRRGVLLRLGASPPRPPRRGPAAITASVSPTQQPEVVDPDVVAAGLDRGADRGAAVLQLVRPAPGRARRPGSRAAVGGS